MTNPLPHAIRVYRRGTIIFQSNDVDPIRSTEIAHSHIRIGADMVKIFKRVDSHSSVEIWRLIKTVTESDLHKKE